MSGGERSVSMTPYLHTFGRFCDDGDLQMMNSDTGQTDRFANSESQNGLYLPSFLGAGAHRREGSNNQYV